jgi:hypothetical protein
LCLQTVTPQRVLPSRALAKSDGAEPKAARRLVAQQLQGPAAGPLEPVAAPEALEQPEEARREQP